MHMGLHTEGWNVANLMQAHAPCKQNCCQVHPSQLACMPYFNRPPAAPRRVLPPCMPSLCTSPHLATFYACHRSWANAVPTGPKHTRPPVHSVVAMRVLVMARSAHHAHSEGPLAVWTDSRQPCASVSVPPMLDHTVMRISDSTSACHLGCQLRIEGAERTCTVRC